MLRTLASLCSVFLAIASLQAADPAPKTRIVLAGDSTVTDAAGWGKAFATHVTPEAECVNLARGGQSTKSYAGMWKKVIEAKPAYVIIQFGHNDMPGKGPERETDPNTTYRENLIRYIKEAREIGAKPILVTSMARRIFEKDGKLRGELKPYADAARKVGADEKVPVVDLFVRSVELLEKIGPAAADEFNPPGKDGATDRTHLNEKGAAVMADIVVDELRKVAPDLAKFLK